MESEDDSSMDVTFAELSNAAEEENSLDIEPAELSNAEDSTIDLVIPEKSKSRYKQKYIQFVKWQQERKKNELTQEVVLDYFKELAITKTPSTLWSSYSMLRSMIKLKHNLNISQYTKLMAFLKDRGKGYVPEKAKVFTSEMIVKFLETAPDSKYLAMKVVAIFGILGACRTEEIVKTTIQDIETRDNMILVTIPKKPPAVSRSFTISDQHFFTVKKYLNLRPNNTESNRLFLTYHDGACIRSPIGKNSLAKMPKIIAQFLGLPNPNAYTGHSFRRTSATLLANAGADLVTLRRHGGWKSSSVVKGYIEESVFQKQNTETLITSKINAASTAFTHEAEGSQEIKMETPTNPADFEEVMLPLKKEVESPPCSPINEFEEVQISDESSTDSISMDSKNVLLVFPPHETSTNEENHVGDKNSNGPINSYPPHVLSALKHFTFNNCNVTIKLNCKNCHR